MCAAGGAWLAYTQFARIDQVVAATWPNDEPAADTTGSVEYGAFTEFQNLIVNPAATDGTRYLAISVGFEAASPEVLDELKAHEIVVRDAILRALGQRTVAELSVVAQRDTIKNEIRTTVNEILQDGEIDRLYFTQFILQ